MNLRTENEGSNLGLKDYEEKSDALLYPFLEVAIVMFSQCIASSITALLFKLNIPYVFVLTPLNSTTGQLF